MSYSPRLAIKYAAFSVAMQAVAGELDQHAIDDLQQRAEQELGSSDGLTRAINGFATQMQLATGDQRAQLGGELRDYLMVLNMPEPPGQDRRDING